MNKKLKAAKEKKSKSELHCSKQIDKPLLARSVLDC